MRTIPGAFLPAALAGFLALGAPASAGAGDKPVKKAQVETIKLTNLTAETPAKQIRKLSKTLKKVKGVKKVTVVKKKGEVKIKLAAPATVEAVRAAIASAGFTIAEPKKPIEAPESDEPMADEAEGESPPLDE